MKVFAKIGWLFVMLGVIGIALTFVKFNSKNEIFQVGGFRASTTSAKRIPELGYGGAALVIVGGILILTTSRRSGKQ